jgi:hypothetical protein
MQGDLIRKLSKLSAMAMLAALALSSAARADIIITISEVGGPSTGPNDVAVGSPSMTGGVSYNPGTSPFGDFTISSAGVSERQLTALSEVLSTALQLTNNGSVAHTLNVTIQASNFTAPTAPPGFELISNLGGTTPAVIGTGPGNAISFQSQVGTSASDATAVQSPDITGNAVSYAAPTQTLGITTGFPGTPPGYSVYQTYSITLDAGATLQFTGRTDLVPTPEPATVAMALTALPLMGLGALARRRRARG